MQYTALYSRTCSFGHVFMWYEFAVRVHHKYMTFAWVSCLHVSEWMTSVLMPNVLDFKQGPCPCVEFIPMLSLHVGARFCQEQHCSHRRFRWWISAWPGFIGSLSSSRLMMSSDHRFCVILQLVFNSALLD